jgi:hypothetical protein
MEAVRKETARRQSLQIIRNQVKLASWTIRPFHMPNRGVTVSCNPLISIDSYERIQGNTAPKNMVFSQRSGTFKEDPNQVDEQRRDRANGSIQMPSGLVIPDPRSGAAIALQSAPNGMAHDNVAARATIYAATAKARRRMS